MQQFDLYQSLSLAEGVRGGDSMCQGLNIFEAVREREVQIRLIGCVCSVCRLRCRRTVVEPMWVCMCEAAMRFSCALAQVAPGPSGILLLSPERPMDTQ